MTQQPVVVDVVDATGTAANGDNAVADLGAAGLTVGMLTTGTDPQASAIRYPAALQQQAQQLAADLGLANLLAEGSGANITIVLGPSDYVPLLEALHRIAASPVCPVP